MSEHVVLSRKTKERLVGYKKQLRVKSVERVINLLLTTYEDKYKDRRLIALEEIKNVIDKYHYLFDEEEFNILGNISPLLMAKPHTRVEILRNLAKCIEEGNKGQKKIVG